MIVRFFSFALMLISVAAVNAAESSHCDAADTHTETAASKIKTQPRVGDTQPGEMRRSPPSKFKPNVPGNTHA